MVLENWKIWLTVLAALILVAYTVPFMDMFQNGPPPSKGFKVW
jgi:cytochrome c oxidase subunit I